MTMAPPASSANTATQTERAELALLRQRLTGAIVLPQDVAYDKARRVWNVMVNKRPALIAYCATPDDVAETVAVARSRQLPWAVRTGGHNVAGS